MEPIIIEGTIDAQRDVEIEDGGCAIIVNPTIDDTDNDFFVRLHSWNDDGNHSVMNHFLQQSQGKKIRITIEVLK